MTDIKSAFQNGKAFIPFVTAGDPDLETTEKLLIEMSKNGADIIEIGIPFSDPIAEGVVIQEADLRSLSAGTTTDKIFDMVKRIRPQIDAVLAVMTYMNPIFVYGTERFMAKCQECGISAVIVPDTPYEEKHELTDYSGKYGIDVISLIAPTSHERIKMIAKEAEGFVYCVSSMGVTGQAATFHKEVISYLSYVKEVSKIPVMMGFGIRTAADVAPMKEIIDGAIVGSHFINLLKDSQFDAQKAAEYCSTFKKELNELV